MNSQEWVRATNALTALEQCGNALAKGIQDQLAALTMAQAVMERTRAWLRDAEPSAEGDRPPTATQRPAQWAEEEIERLYSLITEIVVSLDEGNVLKSYMGASWVKDARLIAEGTPR